MTVKQALEQQINKLAPEQQKELLIKSLALTCSETDEGTESVIDYINDYSPEKFLNTELGKEEEEEEETE